MPGHNGGQGLSSKFRRHAFSVDVTEFSETDNLQEPSGILLQSEENAREVFGAKRSFFIVNGSTLGLEAAILSTTKRGEKLIVDRSCHKAVLSGMILAGVEPVFVEPAFDYENGIYTEILPESIHTALRNNPDAVGVVMTSPNYYGVCSDIQGIAKVVHDADKFLIVDEAHGAHFAFSPNLPKTALEQGADIVIQSAHKTLPSLGQTAILHIGQTEIPNCCDGVQKNINLIQTSSPSFMLLASLDEAVWRMSTSMKKNLEYIIEGIDNLKSKINSLNNISCMPKIGSDYDITKLVVDFSGIGVSGFHAAEILKSKFGIYTEMADQKNVLFYLTASTSMKDLERIENAITEMSGTACMPQIVLDARPLPDLELAVDIGEAYFSNCSIVSCEDSLGRISAEIVVCCPPCCPIIIPGQRIDNKILDYIRKYTDIKTISVLDL